jgi:hypothetical protein
MDITNNISNVIEDIQTDQEGGFVFNQNNLIGTKDISELEGVQIESSDYDVSFDESTGGSSISESNINEILGGNDVNIDMKNFNINELNKNTTFNKLSSNQKTLVINRILEKIPKQKNTKQTSNIQKESYFYCKSCGYNKKIPNKQFIFSRGDEKKDDFYNYRFIDYINDNTLPKTKNYNCINEKCTTHKNPSIKLAVFYRQKDSYNVRYVCSVCKSYWNTFVEK